MGTTEICKVCGAKATRSASSDSFYAFFDCPVCGRYEIIDIDLFPDEEIPTDYNKLASYLYYNGKINKPIADRRFYNFIGAKEMFEHRSASNPWCYHVTKAVVENWYPKTFSEKVDMFLLGLAERANYITEQVFFTDEEYDSACFVIRYAKDNKKLSSDDTNHQVNIFIDYLVRQEYIEATPGICMLLPKGIQRIDALQQNRDKTTKDVFIAMSFAKEMEPVREAIKKAVTECGFNPRIMDEIEHNHQIVPEMLYEIRQARFVIAELTGHNNGAYFEAGYALGHGKEVIQVCNKEKFGEDGHFDVKQINTVMWENEEELTEKLIARIKATVG